MEYLSSEAFPNSGAQPFVITSPKTPHYNCIAWAFGDDTRWYWPDANKQFYWPPDISRSENIDSFIALFASANYEVCDNWSLEDNYSKIAIYADETGRPTHAARQLTDGLWTSKLGRDVDISHSIESMANGFYGNVAVVMKRLL